jgi:alpha-ketoglutarate-dependent taurine dioxygenase
MGNPIGNEESQFQKLKLARPKMVRMSQDALVQCELIPGQRLPFTVQAQIDGVNLVEWARSNRDQVEAHLLTHGAILFRRFEIASITQFGEFTRAVSSDVIEYGERSSPRTSVSDGVYTSTDHPPDQPIVLHNEQSYTLNWPMKIIFLCVQPAEQNGRTPIADSRRIYQRLSPAIVEKFAQKQVRYVRNYGDGLGLPWQEVFQTSSRIAVEEHCRRASIEWRWKDQNRLQTHQIRPAVRRHPKTGETVWFNHALFFNISSLEGTARKAILDVLSEQDVPFNTFYGDGSPIEPSVLDEIREAFRLETVSFPWQKHDILMLDNMLTAHGREPYAGPRKIVVSMADPFAKGLNA